jgi:cellulose synthase/poly-beta-1,6-N-acetylglucosamine synthase-like glycosyltransferase
MILFSLVLGCLGAVLLLPTLADVISLLRALTHRRLDAPRIPATPPRLLVLVPAHDEELVLPACLAALRRLRYPRERIDIVVVADNCHDGTAAIARLTGVGCLERTAPLDPGKPRAIAWALARLPVREYDAMIIVDADTEVDQDFATALAAAAPLADKAVQPYNGVSNGRENALTRMAAILSAANHGLAYVLKTRVGLNVPLSAGMCIGSRVLAAHGWTAYSLCEDWELYAQLTERGIRIEGAPRARIHAQEATTLRVSASQRRRWTGGKITVLTQHAWSLITSRRVRLVQKLDSLAELSALGPVVHLGVVAVAVAVTVTVHPVASGWLAAGMLATLVRPSVYTIAALAREPDPLRALVAFAFLPFYAAWRLGVVVTAPFVSAGGRWVRTGRHGAPA